MQNNTEKAPPAAGADTSLPVKDAAPAVRAPNGTFVAGRSGNPKGREVGSKNYVTKERLALEGAIRAYIGNANLRPKLIKAVDRLIDIAGESPDEKVAVNAMKVLFDKILSSAKQDEDGSIKEAPEVRIIIENATARVAPKVIDAEFTEEAPQ